MNLAHPENGVCTEGIVQTERLAIHHLHWVPERPLGRVLLIGGSNFDLRLKRQFLKTSLAQHAEILTFEPRGIGRTERPDGDWTMEDYALDALALLDAMGWSKTDVLGESFGGMTALHMALLAPERLDRLALASTTAGGAGGASFDISSFLGLSIEEAAASALMLQDNGLEAVRSSDAARFRQLLAERVAFETKFSDPSVVSGGYRRLLEARRDHDVWGRLGEIPHSTLVLLGERDRQAPPEAQRAMAAKLPEAHVVSFDAGHGVAFAEPSTMHTLLHHWYGLGLSQSQGKKEHYG